MAYVHQMVPNLIGGVSQQNPAVRLENQCSVQENIHSTAIDGIHQRPNTEWYKTVGAIAAPTSGFLHLIERDKDEQYFATFTTDATHPVRIFNLAGVEQTVLYGTLDEDHNFSADANVKKYLTESNITDAFTQIKAVSVADYTIVVNTQKQVLRSTAKTAGVSDAVYVYFKTRHVGTHAITLYWKESTVVKSGYWHVQTPTVADTETNYLCAWFGNEENIPDNVKAKMDVVAKGSILTITPKSGQGVDLGSLEVRTEDPWGNMDLIPINWHEVNDLRNLPPRMPTQTKIMIRRNAQGTKENYYMLYRPERATWTETIRWNVEYAWNSSTMPHRIVRLSNGNFVFAPCIWNERRVGDNETNPWPTFHAQLINNVVFHRNRFWFLSKDNVVSSAPGDFFNFFRPTVLEIMDDDPIDLSVASEMVNHLIAGVSFEKGLILFGERSQFVLHSGDQILTTKSVVIDETIRYNINTTCNPVKMGSTIFFPCPLTTYKTTDAPIGRYLSIREYGVMPDTIVQFAPNVSIQIPRYIPNGPLRMTGCNQLDMLFVFSYTDNRSLYVYQFLWEGETKVQQAWMKWTFDFDIWHIEAVGTYLYMLVWDEPNGFMFHRMNLENFETTGADMRYHLDMLVRKVGGSYSEGNDTTSFVVPIQFGANPNQDEWTVINSATSLAFSTSEYGIAGNTVTISGDHADKTIWVGRRYKGLYRFSEWYFKDDHGRPMISGNTQVKRLVLSFFNSGPFKVITTPLNRDPLEEPLTEEMSGIKIGESVIGDVKLLTGEYSFMVAADTKLTNVDIEIDTHLPVSIQTAMWEGIFTMRGRGREN